MERLSCLPNGLFGAWLHFWQLCVSSKTCVCSFSNVKRPCSWSSSSLIVAPALVKGKCLLYVCKAVKSLGSSLLHAVSTCLFLVLRRNLLTPFRKKSSAEVSLMILSVFKSAVWCVFFFRKNKAVLAGFSKLSCKQNAIAIKSCAEQVLRWKFVSYILDANLILSGMANKYENAKLGFINLPSSFYLLSRCKW